MRQIVKQAGITLAALCWLLVSSVAFGQVSVLTQGYDNARDGLNANETTLTASSVTVGNFGKMFNLPVDGYVYAQPLYMPGVTIPNGGGTHNLVFVATEHGSLYAYDADGLQSQPIWRVSLVGLGCPTGFTCTSVPASANGNTTDLLPEISITSTPVIDSSTGTIYAVAKSKEVKGGTTNYTYRLHVLDVTTGLERTGSPVAISGSVSGVTFSPLFSLQRPGLALAGNTIFIAFGSWGDDQSWYGWVFGYDKTSLGQVSILNTTPTGTQGQGGIWMHGSAPGVDANGYLYLTTGNGAFNGTSNYGDSLLKLATPGLSVFDYFTPFNQQTFDSVDLDLASGGVTLLPDSAGTAQHPHIAIACGKNGTVYVLDRDNLGHFNSTSDSQVIQELPVLIGGTQWDGSSYIENCFSTGSYWQGNIYFVGITDAVKRFTFNNGQMSTSAASQTAATYAFPGATPVISANGSTNGILWAVENAGTQGSDRAGTAVLHAYDAITLGELYNTTQASGDAVGPYVKFAVPTVANGKVYVGTQNSVAAYGLISSLPQAPAPSFSPPGGTYATAQLVTISDTLSSGSSTIYYTVDGSMPTTASSVYNGPLSISANTVLRAIVAASGYSASPVTSATYEIGGPGYVFVQGNYSDPQASLSSLAVAYPNAQIQGDLNVVIVGWNDSTAAVAAGGVTDTDGNVYALAAGPTVQSGTATQAIYYAKNIVGGGTNSVTVQFTSAATHPDIRILEYGGIDPSSPADGSGGAVGSSSSSTVSITTTNAVDLIVGGNLVQTTTTAAGTGFTSRMITNPDGDIAEDRLVSSPGTSTAAATLSPSGAWIMQAAAFKTAAASNGAPTVSSISPNSGSMAGGTAVTITGTNFAAGATVTFGGTAATGVTVVNSTTITATTPAHAAGAVTVAVTVNGQTGSLTSGYSYIAPPTVTSVSPSSGSTAGGTAVTITGTNFATGATVTFGGVAATNVVVSNSTTITATTPAGTAGAVTVTVTNPGALAGSLTSGFTYVVVPTVTSVSPNSGTTAGGTAVTITGTNFAAGATVTFGGTAATGVTVVNSTTITATTPAHAAGAVAVAVTVNGQTGSLANGFTYNGTVAISFAQVAAATPQAPTATVSVTYPAAQTAGNLNVVVVGWNDTTSTVQSVKDSAGNTYSVAIGPTSGTGLRQSIYYAANIVGGSNTVTVTFNQAAAYPDIRILEYRGVTTLDVTAGASGTATAASSGPATTTVANELIFGANTVATGNAAAGSGFTSRIITTPDSDLAEDKMVTTAGSNTATATLSSAGPWVMQMVTFSAVSGPIPTVTGVSPNSGTTAGGTAVTVTGTNFVSGATVTFGSAAATAVTVVNSTTITATSPAGSAGAVTVAVTNPGGQSGSLASAYTYVAPPTVTSVSPNSGATAGGTAVTITGTNFATGATVTFGSTAATNVVVSNSTTITATTPGGTAGAVTVVVTNANGLSGNLANGFTYVAPPTVTSVSPNNGSTAGGTAVTITGTNFAAGATVTFGGTAATGVTVVNSTTITATTPTGTAGAVTIAVTVSGQSGSLTSGFTYVVVPTVTSVSPNNGGTAGGTAVTITGTNFATGATVTFGGTAATGVTVVNSTTITATTPAGTAGAVTVAVTVNGQTGSLTNGYSYVAPPTVTSVSPSSGSTAGGTAVTITGTNFATGATVTFGGTVATGVTVVNSTTITATTPAGTAGAVTVTVTNPGALAGSLSNGYTYVLVPTVISVSPNNGTTAGGTAVTITGTNFAAGATVTFGGTAATGVTVVNSTTITATTPAHAAGAVTVAVTVNAQTGSLTNGYSYVAPPTVTGVNPSSGATAGGTAVTITGTNFATGATVTFGGTAATGVTVVNSTTITAMTPTGTAGPVTVAVTVSGQTGSLTSGFTYTANVPSAPGGLTAGAGAGPVVTADQGYINSNFQTTHTTGTFDSTGGDLLVLCASSHFSEVFTPSDSFGNTWIPLGGPTSTATGYDLRTQIWYAPNPIVGPGHTVTMNLSQSMSLVMSVFVVKGSNTSSPIDAISLIGSDNGSQSTSVVSPSVTISSANDLLIGFTKVSAGANFTAGSGFTQQAAASSNFLDAESGPAATPGTYSATFTIDSPQTWQAAVVAVANNPDQTSLSWTASTEAGGTISNYMVERCQGSSCSNFVQIGTTTTTSYNDSGLSASTSYSYRVRAQDTSGITGAYSSVANVTTPAATPSLPGNLTAASPSSTEIDASWMPSTETGGMIGNYLVERCLGAPCSNFAQVGTSATTTYKDTGVTNGNTYSYRVRSSDAASNLGPYSNVATATAATPDSQAPTAPSNLTASAASSSQISLSWTASTDNVGVAGYYIERCQGAGCNLFFRIAVATGTTYNDTGLASGTTYVYRVRAADAAGNFSPYSNVISAATQAAGSPNFSVSASPATASAVPGGQATTTITTTPANGFSNSITLSATGVPSGVTVSFNPGTIPAPGSGSSIMTMTAASGTAVGNYPITVVANGAGIQQTTAVTLAITNHLINYVQSNYADPQAPQTTVGVAYTAAQVAGDLNVVVVGWNDSTATVKSVTDTAGNAYTLAVGPTVINGVESQSIYYAKNIAAAAGGANTVTVTFSTAAAFPDIRVLEYGGADPVNPIDVTAATSGNSTTTSSPAVSTTNATDLLFGANLVQTGTTGPGSGFTSRMITAPDADIAEDEWVAALGSYSATAPVSPSGAWIMQMVAFRAK
ncbi:MAG TPA: IPT/TIG domain-containing protein [Candidatus Sulfotelmatobacter sp.]|nr:IPT/TIG domain-containing protein [Candidatus Sulfotelmatobacter sp.]